MKFLEEALRYATIAELKTWMDHSTIQVNFWGSRLVSVEGYKGSVHLATIADKMMQITIYAWPKKMTFEERLNGIKIAQGIEEHYVKTDEIRRTRNILTQFFGLLQELFNVQGDSYIYLYTTRWNFDGGCLNYVKNTLQNIPKNTFEAAFPNQPIPHSWFDYQGLDLIVLRG
jgi:hypothetical protein